MRSLEFVILNKFQARHCSKILVYKFIKDNLSYEMWLLSYFFNFKNHVPK